MTGGRQSLLETIGTCRGGYPGVPLKPHAGLAGSKTRWSYPPGYPGHDAFPHRPVTSISSPPHRADSTATFLTPPSHGTASTTQIAQAAASGNRAHRLPYRCAPRMDTGTGLDSFQARTCAGMVGRTRWLIPRLATMVVGSVSQIACQDPQPRKARGYCLLLHGSMPLNFPSRFSARGRFERAPTAKGRPGGVLRDMGRTSTRGIAWDRWVE